MAKRPRLSTQTSQKDIKIAPAFKLVLFCVLSLTILSLGVSVFLVIWGAQGENVNRLFEACSTVYIAGFGAIAGLLGGKALP